MHIAVIGAGSPKAKKYHKKSALLIFPSYKQMKENKGGRYNERRNQN